MSKNIIYPTAESFDKDVLANGKLTVVDFWASWCGPCRMLAPIFEEIAAELDGKVAFAKVNVDDEEKLAIRFRVDTIPTLIFFKDGNVVGTSVGYRQKNQLLAMIAAAEKGQLQ